MADRDNPTLQCGKHDIEDELTFTNHTGYVFHDSCGFESGEEHELKTVQEFVRRKSQERRLNHRLHAIWLARFGICNRKFTTLGLIFRYCVPMDNSRPSLQLKHFDAVCPDKNGTSQLGSMD
jgi:hypothetical protein